MPRIKFEDGSYLLSDLNLNLGTCENAYVVHKFGANASVGTSFVPVAVGGVYQTPQAASATTLRVAAGNANDTAAGSGAREVMIQGLNASGETVTEALATNGASAGTASANSYIRLFRAWVSKSGTYANQTTGSHSADIVIENSAGGTTWATINATDYPRGQTEVAFFTAPINKKCYVISAELTTDSSKTTDILLFRRDNILQSAAPYDAMRAVYDTTSSGSGISLGPVTPIGPFEGPCDIGWMAKVDVGTAAVSIDYEVLVVDT